MDETLFIHGPDPNLELAFSDVWLPGLYSRRVFAFELPRDSSHMRVVTILKAALRALVLGTPELGSECVLVPVPESRGTPWKALRPYRGIELIVKDLSKSLPGFKELESQGFPLGVFKDNILMPVPSHIASEPQPQAKFQLSLMEGGILLSACLYHVLTDGNGMNTIIQALGGACKEAANGSERIGPIVLNTDRTLMNSLQGSQTDLIYHPAYVIEPEQITSSTSASSHRRDTNVGAIEILSGISPKGAPPAPLVSAFLPGYFRLTNENAIRLKNDASTPTEPVSTHDAITALLWRTLILARHAAGRVSRSDTVVYSFPVNSRRYVGLPANWVGNCVYFCVVSSPLSDFLEEETGSLPAIAARIRSTINDVDRERVEGLMTLRRSDPYGLTWWPALKPNDPRLLICPSFYHSGLLEVDWGSAFGPVKHFTSTDVGAMADGLRRTSFVGPRFGHGKGCYVMVGADAEELEFFRKDELWNNYF